MAEFLEILEIGDVSILKSPSSYFFLAIFNKYQFLGYKSNSDLVSAIFSNFQYSIMRI